MTPPRILLPALLALLAVLPAPARAHPNARFYRGDIAVSTTWEGVVRLTGTVVIRPGATVSVEPGTEVLVQPGADVDIVVLGRLFVRGLPGRAVVFDTGGGCGAGRWGGIVFRPGSMGILEQVFVRCSTKGVGGDLSAVTKRGAEIR